MFLIEQLKLTGLISTIIKFYVLSYKNIKTGYFMNGNI